MSEVRQELEQRLLANPNDHEARERYADWLLAEGDWSASAAQWELLAAADADRSSTHLGLALCVAAQGDGEAAAGHLRRARQCDDFDAESPRIAELAAAGVEIREPGLRLVGGPAGPPVASGDVLSISSSETVRFSDVIGMEALKKVLRLRIIEPFRNPGLFRRFKRSAGGGVLLYGPPGCGKTMIARAIATECDATFTAVGISDILSMWIGTSEHNLAAIFQKAREEVPAVLFFDELDTLAYSRSKASSEHTRNLVNEFLAQLDGMAGSNDKVLILAATNMPWDVDEAMKRPGRFDRQVFVPPPDAEARAEMFRFKLIDVPAEPLDTENLGQAARHFSGADIDGVIDRAKDAVLDEILESGQERKLRQADLVAALEEQVSSTLEWLKTARNLVKFGGAGGTYRDVEKYLRSTKMF